MITTAQPLGTRQHAILTALANHPDAWLTAPALALAAATTVIDAHQAARSLISRGLAEGHWPAGGQAGIPRARPSVFYHITEEGQAHVE